MRYGRNYIKHQHDKIKGELVSDTPHWLQKAVQQKYPRLTLGLANSILLVYDELDKKLLSLTKLN